MSATSRPLIVSYMPGTARSIGPLALKRFVVALVVGLAVLVLLAPFSGVDTLPPTCYAVFRYQVPCREGVAVAAAVVTTVVIAVYGWIRSRP